MKFSTPHNIIKFNNRKVTKKYFKIELVLFLMLFILITTSCSKEPIKIGFIGDLSTKNSQLAIDARNSVELAVRLLNDNGGIKGRDIQLVVKDDAGSPEVALQKHKELGNEDVEFVIGHLNSNMASAVSKSASVDMLFVSPSMSTTLLSKKDDFFLRSGPINNKQAELFADYAIYNDLKDIVVIYDLMNEEYTKSVAETVELLMEENQTPIKKFITYDTRKDELIEVAKEIIESQPQNIFVIAQASDTAYLIQNVKQSMSEVVTYSVSWSMTKDLISNGGKYVEATKFIGIFNPSVYTEEYLTFEKAFNENYGYDLSFIGVLGYDAFQVLTEGMKKADRINPLDVKNSIISIGEFNGLYKEFTIDEYGDNDREYMTYELHQGEFLPLRDWKD